MFVPLVHPPGHAQADFGEAISIVSVVKIHFFAFHCRTGRLLRGRLSGRDDGSLCDGHVRAFHSSAACRSRYCTGANTKIAVARILGDGKRQRTRVFTELQSHYTYSRIGSADLAKAMTRAKSKDWSAMRDATSSYQSRRSRASRR